MPLWYQPPFDQQSAPPGWVRFEQPSVSYREPTTAYECLKLHRPPLPLNLQLGAMAVSPGSTTRRTPDLTRRLRSVFESQMRDGVNFSMDTLYLSRLSDELQNQLLPAVHHPPDDRAYTQWLKEWILSDHEAIAVHMHEELRYEADQAGALRVQLLRLANHFLRAPWFRDTADGLRGARWEHVDYHVASGRSDFQAWLVHEEGGQRSHDSVFEYKPPTKLTDDDMDDISQLSRIGFTLKIVDRAIVVQPLGVYRRQVSQAVKRALLQIFVEFHAHKVTRVVLSNGNISIIFLYDSLGTVRASDMIGLLNLPGEISHVEALVALARTRGPAIDPSAFLDLFNATGLNSMPVPPVGLDMAVSESGPFGFGGQNSNDGTRVGGLASVSPSNAAAAGPGVHSERSSTRYQVNSFWFHYNRYSKTSMTPTTFCPIATELSLDPEARQGLQIGSLRGRGRLWEVYSGVILPTRSWHSAEAPSHRLIQTVSNRSVTQGSKAYQSAPSNTAPCDADPDNSSDHIPSDSDSDDCKRTNTTMDTSRSSSPLSQIFPGATHRNIVVKVLRPMAMGHDEDGYTPGDAIQAALREAALYTGPLQALQGRSVPRFLGLWSDQTSNERMPSMMVMILEDVGPSIRGSDHQTGWYGLHDNDMRRILSCYRDLHSVGVVHGDLEIRHCRQPVQGQLRLIDFEGGQLAGIGSDAIQKEKDEIQALLGVDTTAWNDELYERFDEKRHD